jgi:hypothetical protein
VPAQVILAFVLSVGDVAVAFRVVVAAASEVSELFRKEAIAICEILIVNEFDSSFFLEIALTATVLSWNQHVTYELWTRTVRVMCLLCLLGGPSVATHLMGLGFVGLLTENILLMRLNIWCQDCIACWRCGKWTQ